MRRILAAALAVTLSLMLSVPASAKAVDASTVTCTEMLAIASAGDSKENSESQARIGVMLMWMQGYQAPADHGTVADVKAIMGDIDRVVEMCTKSPNLGLMTVTEKLWDGDSEPSKEAVDLSTVKCDAMLKANDTERASMVVWLLGYNAAVDEDPMFDLDAVGEKVTNLATYCTENPEMGLVTASGKSEE